MMQGVCIGGGLALAACADLRVAADDARLALPPARLGLGYAFSGRRSSREPGRAPAAASESSSPPGTYTAADALRIGLVNQVVAKADLETLHTDATPKASPTNAPLTIRAAKRAIIAETQRDPADPRPGDGTAPDRRMLRERRLRRGRAAHSSRSANRNFRGE